MTSSGAASTADEVPVEAATPTTTQHLAGRLAPAALIALAPASIIYLSFNDGGFFPSATGLAAVGFAAALVARTTLAEHPFEGYNRELGILLLALAAFASLQLASALWSHDTAGALDEYDRTLLYLLALALFGSMARTPARLQWLIRSLAAGMTAVCVVGLVSRVLPHVWPTAASFYANRLDYPLTYWNAEGLVAALATILLVHLTSTEHEHPGSRVLAAMFVPATAATVLFTFSRGAIAVSIIGVIAYLVLGRPRAFLGAAVSLIPTSAIALHAAYAAQLLASSKPTSPAAIVQGHHVAGTIGGCMLAAAGLRLAMLGPDGWVVGRLAGLRAPKVPGRVVALAAGAAVAAVALGLGVSGVASREWNQFAHGKAAGAGPTRGRLTNLAGENRVGLWRIALHAFGDRPALGYGAASYELYYDQHRADPTDVVDAHNIYVQALAEVGIVGFIALAAVIIGALVLLAIRIRGPDRVAYAALFAVCFAWAIEVGFDWDWEMPAATLWLFIAIGLALASPPRQPARHQPELRNRNLIAVGFAVLAVAPLLVGVSYQRLRASGQQLAVGDCVKARQDAFSSMSLLAVRPEAYAIVSLCDLQIGFPLEGLEAAKKALHYASDNWNYEYGLALALAENGLDPRSAARKALRLNPLEPIVQDEMTTFSQTRRGGWDQAARELLVGGLESGGLAVSNL